MRAVKLSSELPPDATPSDIIALQRKPKGAIGIVGFNPVQVAKLNKLIIQYGNSIGLKDDQHFPDIIAIGIATTDARYLDDQVNLCSDYGCDLIAMVEPQTDSLKNASMSDKFGIPVMMLTDEDKALRNLAKAVLDRSIAIDRPVRGNLACFKEIGDGAKQIFDNLALASRDTEKRVADRLTHGKYPILKATRKERGDVVGILGGAGPAASAELFGKLAEMGTPAIHLSVNGAPGKFRFEREGGPSYIPYYQSALQFFKQIKVGSIEIPCNTAHKRLEEFAGSIEMLGSVIDIRTAVLSDNKNATAFILLGTNPTNGVGLPEGEVGIYEEYRRRCFAEERPFVVPSEAQQAKIMSAIADVKAGEFKEAKAKIMDVIENIRALPGCNLPVILGCTELPLVFTTLELSRDRLLDPANSLSKIAQKVLTGKLTDAARAHGASSLTETVGTSPSIKGGSDSSAASRLSSGSAASASDRSTTPTARGAQTSAAGGRS
jgi:aspartate racemase